eukprot:COSAG05_NODE_8838_length_667_cov_1.278169_2_plen_31_part_01
MASAAPWVVAGMAFALLLQAECGTTTAMIVV